MGQLEKGTMANGYKDDGGPTSIETKVEGKGKGDERENGNDEPRRVDESNRMGYKENM